MSRHQFVPIFGSSIFLVTPHLLYFPCKFSLLQIRNTLCPYATGNYHTNKFNIVDYRNWIFGFKTCLLYLHFLRTAVEDVLFLAWYAHTARMNSLIPSLVHPVLAKVLAPCGRNTTSKLRTAEECYLITLCNRLLSCRTMKHRRDLGTRKKSSKSAILQIETVFNMERLPGFSSWFSPRPEVYFAALPEPPYLQYLCEPANILIIRLIARPIVALAMSPGLKAPCPQLICMSWRMDRWASIKGQKIHANFPKFRVSWDPVKTPARLSTQAYKYGKAPAMTGCAIFSTVALPTLVWFCPPLSSEGRSVPVKHFGYCLR